MPSGVSPTSVLDGYLLQILHRDKPLGKTLQFIVRQLNRLQAEAEGQAIAGGLTAPSGLENMTLFHTDDTGRALPVADRSIFTHPEITATQTAYNLGVMYYNRMSTDATRSIQGILPGTAGQRALVANVGSFRLVLAHDNAGAADVRNRILCVGGADILLLPNDMAMIWRDPVSDRWRAWQL